MDREDPFDKYRVSEEDLNWAVERLSQRYPDLSAKTTEKEVRLILGDEVIGRGPIEPHTLAESLPYRDERLWKYFKAEALTDEKVSAYLSAYTLATRHKLGLTDEDHIPDHIRNLEDTLKLLHYRDHPVVSRH